MKDKIKEFSKKYLLGFTLGMLSAGIMSVAAAAVFPSNQTTYDNSNTGMQATEVQGAIDELYTTCFPPTPPASDTITDLVDTNPDELYKDEHGDIRYYGKSPNNYVSFNNELWRIIGVIEGKIKIIRNEKIGNMAWASNGYNNWDNASLKSYLNGEYYNSIDITYKNMISEETYYLGGPKFNNYSSLTASGYYDVERSNTVCHDCPTSTTQYIGLMYPSDYGYAGEKRCLSTSLYNYENGGCLNTNYLNSGGKQWLQTPFMGSNTTAVYLNGYVYTGSSDTDVTLSIAVRPSLYLTSETKITGGDGSQSNPFQLSL